MFLLSVVNSLSGYNCIADIKSELQVKKQSTIILMATALTFSIDPATKWLIARYGYQDSFSVTCHIMPIVFHKLCLAANDFGKYVLGFKMNCSVGPDSYFHYQAET